MTTSRMGRMVVAAGLAVAITTSGCTTATAGRPAAGTPAELPTGIPSDADIAAVDAAARATFDGLRDRASALYVGIWDPEKGTFRRAYGQAVRDDVPATIEDSLRIASITKTFTATVVLQLAGEGKLSLTDTVAEHLPNLVNTHPNLRPITVEQLLSMRSGLPDYWENASGIGRDIVADPMQVWTPAELVAAALRDDVAEPGTAGYSNTNYVLLQLIAEEVTDQPLRELIADRLTEPLGLRHTVLPPDDDTALPEPAAHGYLNQACVDLAAAVGVGGVDAGTDTTDWNISYTQGAGGMTSTLTDVGRWAATTSGTDLLPENAEQRLDTHDIGLGDIEYGLGIERYGSWYGHDGEALGWQTIALHNPSTGVTFVAAVNACSGMRDDLLGLLRTLYPD